MNADSRPRQKQNLVTQNACWIPVRNQYSGDSVADPDPGSGAFLTLDPGTGSGMINPDHTYFRELRISFWVKIPKFFDADPG
jgi:hypothetical protein